MKELGERDHHRDENRYRQYGMAARVTPKIQRPFHSLISLPVTTPEATEMIAFPVMGSSVRATPFLTGASTVLLPLLSTAVKETTVPSGTLLLRQSFTGSVSTSTPFAVRRAFMCRLHASEATCRMMRGSSLLPMVAMIFTGPSFGVGLIFIQATP